MGAQSFKGRDLREALSAAKAALGEDAMVLSTQHVRDGIFGRAVEVLAEAGETPEQKTEAAILAYERRAEAPVAAPSIDARLRPLEAEMRRLRTQLVSIVTRPVKSHTGVDVKADTHTLTHLLQLGFSLETARAWSARLQQSKDPMLAVEKLVWDSVDVTGSLGENGAKIVVCVGPSGAGKTTTIAKWAARAALAEDKRVVVITLDGFRAGAVDQLRRYTDLIGCELVAPTTTHDLFTAIDRHANADLILIDTAGRDPSTQGELESVCKEILRRDKRAEIHLALPAMYGPRSLRTVVKSYRRFGVNRLCFTKLDEAPELAPLVAVIVNERLPLSYWTTGQRIPDDIELVSSQGAVDRLAPALVSLLCGDDIVIEECFV